MNPLPLLIFLALGAIALADPPTPVESVFGSAATATATPPPVALAPEGWNVVGKWQAAHTRWQGTITLKPDGTLINNENEPSGHWALSSRDGRLQLVLAWGNYPAEIVTLRDSKDFFGPANLGDIRLRRPDQPALTPGQSNDKPWTVAGTWDCTHRDWTGPVTLQPDGTIASDGDPNAGRWGLSPTDDGRVLLILKWREWPAEIVTMLSPDEFHGNPTQGDLHMRRQGATRTTRANAPAEIDKQSSPQNVIGVWDCNQSRWNAALTLNADGTFLYEDHKAGRWELGTADNRPQLTLRWDHWGAETVSMVKDGEFFGRNGDSELRMRRRALAMQ